MSLFQLVVSLELFSEDFEVPVLLDGAADHSLDSLEGQHIGHVHTGAVKRLGEGAEELFYDATAVCRDQLPFKICNYEIQLFLSKS